MFDIRHIRSIRKDKTEYTQNDVEVLQELQQELIKSYSKVLEYRSKLHENGDHDLDKMTLKEYYENFATIRGVAQKDLEKELEKEQNLIHAGSVYLFGRKPAVDNSVSDGKDIEPDRYDDIMIFTLIRLGVKLPVDKKDYVQDVKKATSQEIMANSKKITSKRNALEFTIGAIDDYIENIIHNTIYSGGQYTEDHISFLELQQYILGKELNKIAKIYEKFTSSVVKQQLKHPTFNAEESEISK